MSDAPYTPSIERAIDLYSWATAWNAGTHDGRPDLANMQVRQRGEIQRAIAAHVASEVERLADANEQADQGFRMPPAMFADWLRARAAEIREGKPNG